MTMTQNTTAAQRESLRYEIRHLITAIDAEAMTPTATSSVDVWKVLMPGADGRCVEIEIALPLAAAVIVEEQSDWTIRIA